MNIVNLLMPLFFSAVLQAASAEPEILYERLKHHNAGNAGMMTDKTYPHSYRVINDPRMVSICKQQLVTAGMESVEFSAMNMDGLVGITKFGMGEAKFAVGDLGFLHTDGLRDCIAFVAFDRVTKKSCLYHVSKMEIRINDFGDRLFETWFVPEFLKAFSGLKPDVFLIASCYSEDLTLLHTLLEKHSIAVSGFNIPNVCLEEIKEVDQVSGLTTKGSFTLFIDKNTTKLLSNTTPSTSVLLNTQDCSISVDRQF